MYYISYAKCYKYILIKIYIILTNLLLLYCKYNKPISSNSVKFEKII